MRAVALVVLLIACGDNVRGNIALESPGPWRGAFSEFVSLSNYGGLVLGTEGDFRISIVQDPAIPAESYRIDSIGVDHWTVRARDILGAQYGAADAIESLGLRFRHPFETYVPREIAGAPETGVLHEPEIRVRGFQLHTLHPIESYFGFWEPSAGSLNDARRIIDWIIKNRGNYVEWVALDDIMDPANPDKHAAWKAHTQAIIEYAHSRGVRVGLNIQLFGSSNLQAAFDLHDDEKVAVPESIDQRLPLITQDLPFDIYHLSFGEFFGTDPAVFISSTNEVLRQLRLRAPQAELHGFVHVGKTHRVTYMNRDLIYYFLVQYADPTITPDIHTVMYYNLYDDAGGAYQHDMFDEHKQYLLDRMCANLPVSYVPETGYWVAFDNSVPMYLPLYVYSRWRDLDGLSKEGCGPLDQHILFTTGWEWGYWLHDVTALRASYELPPSPKQLIEHAYAPDLGAAGADLIDQLMNEQKRALIDQRLAGYLSARDAVIDIGRMADPPIISQPDRIQFMQMLAPDFDLGAFQTNVVDALDAHADKLDELAGKLAALDLADTRWTREVSQGFEIDRLRARFMHLLYNATAARAGGGSGKADYDRAVALLAEATKVVQARHGDLHDTHRRRLLDKVSNATVYQYGYLYHADSLCYWKRELIQVGNILGTSTETPPACFF